MSFVALYNCIRRITLLVVVKFLPLETIEEEADQTLRSHASDEDFLVPVEVEAEPAEAQSEEDDVGFRVMRARRKTSRHGSRSSGESRNSCPPLQMGLSQHEDTPVQCHDSHAGSGKKRARTHQKSTSRTLRKSVSLCCSFSMRSQVFFPYTSRSGMFLVDTIHMLKQKENWHLHKHQQGEKVSLSGSLFALTGLIF